MNTPVALLLQRAAGFLVAPSLFIATAVAAESGGGVRRPDPSPYASGVAAGETIQLSPFEVAADPGDTYDATNTNSVTGTTFSLDKTPLDAKIFNRTLMDELAVSDVSDMLVNFGGLGPAILSPGTENQSGLLAGDAKDYKAMSSRGLRISNPRRDGFLRSDTSLMDSFDVESSEVVLGSNSLLFGSGDAGGVVNVNSKRARLNQRFAKFTTTWDSEGSLRFTTDLNYGNKVVGIRINGLEGNDRYFRPVLRLRQEGLQVAPIVRPLPWLTLFGEYRHLDRNNINSGNPKAETVRAPTTLILSNGERLDAQPVRKITGLGGPALLGNFLTLTNQDSISGAYKRHYYIVEGQSVGFEARASNDLYFQFRYGQDERNNFSVAPGDTVLYHPDAPGNLYADSSGRRQWAMNTSPTMTSTQQGARGFKLTGVYHKDAGRWGNHWLNAIFSHQFVSNAAFPWRYYEANASGEIITDPTKINDAQSGRILMPNAWVTPFSAKIFQGYDWPAPYLINPSNGKLYKFSPQRYERAVASTPGNPLGISGPLDPVTGTTTGGYTRTKVRERAGAASLSSEVWRGRINTMLGFRTDRADRVDYRNLTVKGPLNYNSTTLGAVFDTPVRGLRGYVAYATNGNPNFDAGLDIFNEQLPDGRGVSREGGLKFSMWEHRLSGNLSYYVSEGQNFLGSLGALRDDVDPDGINGRHGGDGYVYSRKSDGIDLRLTARPLKNWQVTVNYSEANGSERKNVAFPIFYNDEFNTTTVNGVQVVGVRNGATVTPLMVASVPGNATSPRTTLSLAMMKDSSSPYFAVLDPESGKILNASALGLTAAGVGTGRNGAPVAEHQLGFVPPTPTIIVRRAGERTAGYAEHSFSLINRYQFTEGRLRGLVVGMTNVYHRGFRAYMYTDTLNGGVRKMLYYPDIFENSVFSLYRFKPMQKMHAFARVSVSNVLDKQAVVTLPSSTTGRVNAFTYQYTPRRFVVSTGVEF